MFEKTWAKGIADLASSLRTHTAADNVHETNIERGRGRIVRTVSSWLFLAVLTSALTWTAADFVRLDFPLASNEQGSIRIGDLYFRSAGDLAAFSIFALIALRLWFCMISRSSSLLRTVRSAGK